MCLIFKMAHEFTARWEGGFVNHPADPGGATNYGLSLRFLRAEEIDVDGDGDTDIDDIRALTPQSSAELFKKYFWDKPRLGELPELVAMCVYDAGVNMGVARAVRILQDCCGRLLPAEATPAIDGWLGPVTLRAVRRVCAKGTDGRTARAGTDIHAEMALCDMMLQARLDYYDELRKERPELRAFYQGWQNRTNSLYDYLKSFVRRAK